MPRFGLAAVFAISLWGAPYYLLPAGERLRHPAHAVFKPTGSVGQTMGIVAFALFLFLWLYPMRKRVRWLLALGRLPRWLDLHIFAGMAVPIFAAGHAGWRFRGLIGLGYLAMFVVCLSGFVGRYLYRRIPHARDGRELTQAQIEQERTDRLDELGAATGLSRDRISAWWPATRTADDTSWLAAIIGLFSADLIAFRAGRRLRRELSAVGVVVPRAELRRLVQIARKDVALSHQLQLLDATRAIFRFWHIAHLPFAITALIAVVIHVVAAVLLGVTWFR